MNISHHAVKRLRELPPDAQVIVVTLYYGDAVIMPYSHENMRVALEMQINACQVDWKEKVTPLGGNPTIRVVPRGVLDIPEPDVPAAEQPQA